MRFSVSNVFALSCVILVSLSFASVTVLPGYAGSNVEVMDAHGAPLMENRDSLQRINRMENSLITPANPSGVFLPESAASTPITPAAAPSSVATKTKTATTPKRKSASTVKNTTPQTEPQTANSQPLKSSSETIVTAPNPKPVANPRTISNAKMTELNPALASLTNIQKDAIRHLDRATQLGTKGQLKAAFLEYESALRINPKLADAYVGKAAVYGYQGEWEKAVTSLQTALNMDTDFITPANRINAQFNLSSCYCFQGNAQNAWDNYRQNLEGKHPRANALVSFMTKTCPEAQSTSAQPSP